MNFVPKTSIEVLNPCLSNDKIEFCKSSLLMSYISEISKKIKDGSIPMISHLFFDVVAKLGDKKGYLCLYLLVWVLKNLRVVVIVTFSRIRLVLCW